MHNYAEGWVKLFYKWNTILDYIWGELADCVKFATAECAPEIGQVQMGEPGRDKPMRAEFDSVSSGRFSHGGAGPRRRSESILHAMQRMQRE